MNNRENALARRHARWDAVTSLRYAALLALVLSLFVLLPNSPVFTRVPSRDSGVFLYSGSQILQGKILYSDLWDHKPPLVHFIDAFGLLISNGSVWGVWFLELVFLIVDGLLLFYLIRKMFSPITAYLVVSFFYMALYMLFGGGNYTEEYSIPLILGAYLLLYQVSVDRKRIELYSFGLGVLFALVFLLRQNGAALWVGVILFLILIAKFSKTLVRSLAAFSAGSLIPLAGVTAYFYAHGALSDFYRAAFAYNFVYTGSVSFLDKLTHFHKEIVYLLNASSVFDLVFSGWLLAVAVLFYLWISRASARLPGKNTAAAIRKNLAHLGAISYAPATRYILILAVFSFLFEIFMADFSSLFYEHYYMLILPTAAVLLAFLIDVLIRTPETGRLQWIPLSIAVIFLAVNAVIPVYTLYVKLSSYNDEVTTHAQVVAYILQNSAPNDTVLVWGDEPAINFLSGRESPIAYFYQYPLYFQGYILKQEEQKTLAELSAHPPKILIDTHNACTPLFFTDPANRCRRPISPLNPAIKAFIQTNYRFAERKVDSDRRYDIYLYHPSGS